MKLRNTLLAFLASIAIGCGVQKGVQEYNSTQNKSFSESINEMEPSWMPSGNDNIGQLGGIVETQVRVPEGKKPARRMFSVCESKEASTIEEGLENLKEILPVWVEEGMNGGALYVNGGLTRRSTLKCSNAAREDFIKDSLAKYFPSETIPKDLSLNQLRQLYRKKIVKEVSGKYLCADCITYQVQMYKCAFGDLTPHSTNPKTAPIIASWTSKKGNCWDNAVMEDLDGKLEFGDIIQLEPNHYVMYAGDEGVEYNGSNYQIVGMGAFAFKKVSTKKAKIKKRINGKKMNGMSLVDDVENALKSEDIQKCWIRRPGLKEKL